MKTRYSECSELVISNRVEEGEGEFVELETTVKDHEKKGRVSEYSYGDTKTSDNSPLYNRHRLLGYTNEVREGTELSTSSP